MHILIYVGSAPSRESVIQFSAPIVRHVASAVTLVTGGGAAQQKLLDSAAERMNVPAHVAVTQRTLPGDAQTAILTAAREQQYDLAIFGRLHQRIGRLLPGPHSKAIAQRLNLAVLRVHGPARPIKRILLASGGDRHTFDNVRVAAQLAVPLNAEVTLLHVTSQQSVVFTLARADRVEGLLTGNTNEAQILRDARARLEAQGLTVQVKGRVGPVIDEILSELRVGSYDLLVIGAHRVVSALDRILLEDITGDLLDVSPLPVLVVKG